MRQINVGGNTRDQIVSRHATATLVFWANRSQENCSAYRVLGVSTSRCQTTLRLTYCLLCIRIITDLRIGVRPRPGRANTNTIVAASAYRSEYGGANSFSFAMRESSLYPDTRPHNCSILGPTLSQLGRGSQAKPKVRNFGTPQPGARLQIAERPVYARHRHPPESTSERHVPTRLSST